MRNKIAGSFSGAYVIPERGGSLGAELADRFLLSGSSVSRRKARAREWQIQWWVGFGALVPLIGAMAGGGQLTWPVITMVFERFSIEARTGGCRNR